VKVGGIRVWRPKLLGLIFLALVGAGTWGLLAAGASGVAIATVLAVTVAVLLGAAQFFGVTWQPPEPAKLAAEARKLADAVRQRETGEQNLFLADSAEGKPADVIVVPPEQWSWQLEQVTWRSADGEQNGSLRDIARLYAGSDTQAGISNGRLVILGDAGAGKTVLANQLLLDLTAPLVAADPPPGARRRVPVRLSLPAFDPGVSDGQTDSKIVASRLDAWIASQIEDAFGLSQRIASALVGEGWILPILDGLDEMDPDKGDAVRAVATVRALNSPGSGGVRPVVVTCRNDRYKHLAAAPAPPGQEQVVQDAVAVELKPVSPEQVAAYLVRRFPDPADRAQAQPRWKPVLDQVKAGGPLAEALGSPLRLFMAVTAYYQPGTKPTDLCELTTDAIDQKLFDNFIPAVTGQNKKPGGGYYDAADVTRWLRTLACHLKKQQQTGGSGSDIDIATLWTATNQDTPRRLGTAIQLLLTGLPFLLAGGIFVRLAGHIAQTPRQWIGVGVCLAVVALAVLRASLPEVRLIRFDPSQLRTAAGRRQLAIGFGFGALAGAGWAFVILFLSYRPLLGHTIGLKVILGGAIALGIIGILANEALSGLPAAVSRPGELVAQGLIHDLVVPLACGIAGAIFVGLGPTLIFGITGVTSIAAYDIAFGFAFGVGLGTGLVAQSPWPRYFVAVRMLSRRQDLPGHPAAFLDWAYSAGLLRLAGIAVQFRHRDLQDQLSKASGSSSYDGGHLDPQASLPQQL
jgi:hypothetical protein